MIAGAESGLSLQRRRQPAKLDFALPTINIIFLLTLYFLLSGTLAARRELIADLPLTQNVALERLPRPLLTISADGSLMVDGTLVSTAELIPAAQAAVAAAPQPRINVVAPRLADARPIFALLAELARNGIAVRIVTERPPAAEGGGS